MNFDPLFSEKLMILNLVDRLNNKLKESWDTPYLLEVDIAYMFNPAFGLNRMCVCGHTYERHFDSDGSYAPIGCKYCDCYRFVEQPHEKTP